MWLRVAKYIDEKGDFGIVADRSDDEHTIDFRQSQCTYAVSDVPVLRESVFFSQNGVQPFVDLVQPF